MRNFKDQEEYDLANQAVAMDILVLFFWGKVELSDWGVALRARANFLSLQNRPKRWGTGRRSA